MLRARPDYSIVVPAFNEEALLPATLDRLNRAMAVTSLAGEIVVCDNNSTDATATVARDHGATVVFEPVNQISRARNAGARAARGRFLLFVDADTEIPTALLQAALERLSSGQVSGGGATVAMEGIGRGLPSYLVSLWNALSRARHLAAGSFVFVLREAFDAVGGFSEKVYASEEIWLSRAVRRWGRPRGLRFEIIASPPVVTSGRKTEWYPTPVLLPVALLIMLMPFLLRSRRFCWLWYRRPADRL